MWTPTALASETHAASGRLWRVVEHQYTISSRKVVDTDAEQAVLETLLEATKPNYPAECEHLDYLLKTPFRYHPVPPGSRFRRPGPGPGVFYACEDRRTALAEMVYWRYRFFHASPGTPLPRHAEQLTLFGVAYEATRALDLTRPPLHREHGTWTDPCDYTGTQQLAEAARRAGVESLRYASVRDPATGYNVALLACRVFCDPAPGPLQSWSLYLSDLEATCRRTVSAEVYAFARDGFVFC
jgi:hypothetical protein